MVRAKYVLISGVEFLTVFDTEGNEYQKIKTTCPPPVEYTHEPKPGRKKNRDQEKGKKECKEDYKDNQAISCMQSS